MKLVLLFTTALIALPLVASDPERLGRGERDPAVAGDIVPVATIARMGGRSAVLPDAMPSKIFLLSPAHVGGKRASQLTSANASFEAALLYRSRDGVPIAAAFAFMSALYFRGKIAYAAHFARPSTRFGGRGIYVIAPGFGLVSPDWCITEERMSVLRRTSVDLRETTYTKPLEREAEAVASRLDTNAQVILLGSVASGKYVDVLLPIFGNRLRFPGAFAGLGDMSRGGLMLRAVRENRELEYTTLDARRHRAPGQSGKMPALSGSDER